MKKKIIIAAGGTGGHLIPAEALSKQLLEKYDIVLLGHGVEQSPYLNDHTIQKKDIPAKSLPSSIASIIPFIWQTLRGWIKARRTLRELKPALVIGFGSFHSFPVLLAACSLNIPIGLFEANRIPGKVVRLFSRFAFWVASPYKMPLHQIKTIQEEVSYPLRKEFSLEKAENAKEIKEGSFTILVMGGSQGASFLNEQIPSALAPYHKEIAHVTHLYGKHGNQEQIEKLYADANISASVLRYSNEVAKLMQSADFAICRSGATTLAELEESGLPALLIPYPYAYAHQVENAQYFCDIKGGGWWLLQKEADQTKLQELIGKILSSPLELEKAKGNLANRAKARKLGDLIELTIKRCSDPVLEIL